MQRRTASGLLFAAVLAHNSEEATTYASTRPAATALIRRAWPGVELPAPLAFQVAALVLTVALGLLLFWAARTPHERAGWLAVKATAAVFLANVLIPHVPAAIALGGYAPGVVTAVAVNLPLTLWILLRGGVSPAPSGRPSA